MKEFTNNSYIPCQWTAHNCTVLDRSHNFWKFTVSDGREFLNIKEKGKADARTEQVSIEIKNSPRPQTSGAVNCERKFSNDV